VAARALSGWSICTTTEKNLNSFTHLKTIIVTTQHCTWRFILQSTLCRETIIF